MRPPSASDSLPPRRRLRTHQTSPTTARVSPVTLTAENAPAGSDGNTTVTFSMTNRGPDNGFVLNLTLPENVTVIGQSADGGQWSADRTAWIYQTVSTGQTVTPSVTVSVPEETGRSYNITGLAKTSDGLAARAVAQVPCDSVTGAIDDNDDGRIGDFEVLDAIELWRNGDTVPGTCGERIGDFQILDIIELWRDGSSV